MKVFAKGRTPEEVKENLKRHVEQAISTIHSIQATYKVLRMFDLQDFIEAQLVSRTTRSVSGF